MLLPGDAMSWNLLQQSNWIELFSLKLFKMVDSFGVDNIDKW